ncbi:MAG: TIGR00296 family protein [Nitrososphaerales archaeon]|nr:TIGR00296 family protein [Nitrososphaerales archaeon]
MHLSAEQGKALVQLARSTLDSFVLRRERGPTTMQNEYLAEKRGVFVTLSLLEGRERSLRGCIGFPHPTKPLGIAVQEATIAAASEDPRFPPVQSGELSSIVVEVSILTVPVPVEVRRRQDLPSKVKIGEDGLIISTSFTSGILLPQVAVEHGMGAEEFLSQACMKAGLTPDSWLDESTTVQTFGADIFAERTPGGDAARVEL